MDPLQGWRLTSAKGEKIHSGWCQGHEAVGPDKLGRLERTPWSPGCPTTKARPLEGSPSHCRVRGHGGRLAPR